MTIDRIMLVVLGAFIAFTVMLIVDSETKDEECRKRGGTTISTPAGRVCAKIERV